MEIFLLLVVVGFVMALVVAAIMLHILLGLILLPFQIAFGVLKGIFVGLLALPLMALGAGLLVGVIAIAGAVGLAVCVLSLIF